MAYEKQEWKPGKSGGTPFTADRMNHMEEGILAGSTVPGPQGKTGPAGPKGEKGDAGVQGPAGKDATPQFTADEVTKIKALIAQPAE